MTTRFYYHLYAEGNLARNLVINLSDYRALFNLIAVCAFNSGLKILAFSIEDTHPHLLAYGTEDEVKHFKRLFESSVKQHILSTRKTLDGVMFSLQIDKITDIDHLRNTGTYVVAQPTKDHKAVMPYDYRWGTGCLYFRSEPYTPVWLFDDNGCLTEPVPVGSLPYAAQEDIRCSRKPVPDDWLVCNGLILPANYVDVQMYESIYQTHNCFRVFLCSGKNKETEIMDRMASSSGVMLEDLEARRVCTELCRMLFGKSTARWLDTGQRLTLARELRNRYRMSFRQIATLSRLPESEVRAYVK